VFHNVSDHLRLLTIRTANGTTQVLRTTDGHPFWVPDRGWVYAGELQPGAALLQPDRKLAVVVATLREEYPERIPIFNFEVEEYHTYFVAAQDTRAQLILVHNVSMDHPSARALRDLVNDATNGGRKPLSVDDANAVLDLAQEINYPGWRAGPGDVASPSNWAGGGGQPHIHIPGAGRGGHVPVAPGVAPR
jgi:hypothetical protein